MITHKGGCHCLRVPKSQFTLLSGEEVLTTCDFNTRTGYSVNARCLDEGTVEGMSIVAKDGRNWEKTFARHD